MLAHSIAATCISAIFFILVIGTKQIFSRKELITPWLLFAALYIIDVFIPGIRFAYGSPADTPHWMAPIQLLDFQNPILYFNIGFLIFTVFYFLATNNSPIKDDTRKTTLNYRLAYFIFFTAIAFYLFSIALDIRHKGFDIFLSLKLSRARVITSPVPLNVYENIIQKVAPYAITVTSLISVIFFYFRKKYHRPFIWGVVYPLIGWGMNTTTFFRGSQINFFLSLFLIENFRIISEESSEKRTQFFNRSILIIASVAVLFFSYGTMRNYITTREYGTPMSISESFLFEMERFISGPSLIGATSVIKKFPEDTAYLNGKTYLDMFAIFIPRAFWPEKPEWYGMDDISKRMSWPSSTQSSLSILGEGYANFGIYGLFAFAFFGFAFGFFYRQSSSIRFRFIYCVTCIPMVFVTFWMSFSGFMNALIWIPFSYIITRICIRTTEP